MARKRIPLEERLWAKVDKHGPVPAWIPSLGECWVWSGVATDRGYGQIQATRDGTWKRVYVHRLCWELQNGPIPSGQTVDHRCRNRRCVNPEHLEVVPRSENSARGAFGPRFARRQVLCLRGHPLSGKNLYLSQGGQRHCRTCRAARQAAHGWSVKRQRAEIAATKRALLSAGVQIPGAAALINQASEAAEGRADPLAATHVGEFRATLVSQLLEGARMMMRMSRLLWVFGDGPTAVQAAA